MNSHNENLLRHYVNLLIASGITGPQLQATVAARADGLGIDASLIPRDVLTAVAARIEPAQQLPTAAAPPAAAAPMHLPSMQQQQWLAMVQQHAQQQQLLMAQQQAAAPGASKAASAAAMPYNSTQLTALRAAQLAQLNRVDSGKSSGSTAPLAAAGPAKHKAAAVDAVAAAAAAAKAAAEPEEEQDAGQAAGTDENEDGHTYAEYRSVQVRNQHPEIMGHPDPLVETASLASVPLPPASFHHALDDCVRHKLLSDAQLETVIYANMKFNMHLTDGKRAGFFLGDGAGVGKGRQIAALIKQHFKDGGRRALWVSVSADLRIDAARDLKDVNAANIPICPRGSESVPTGRGLEKWGDGCLFITYSLLISGLGGKKGKRAAEEAAEGGAPGVEQGRISVPPTSRLASIINWLKGTSEPPLIVFDECHKAKNLLPSGGSQPTQTARAVVELQEQIPDAKVLYSSATGASEPKQLAYMTRLGLFGFKDAADMIDLLSKSKLGALELAAMSLKATGSYLSRTLSYAGAEFALGYVDVDPMFKVMYDRSTMLWTLLWKIVQSHPRMKKLQGVFWSANQRFYKQMLMASKVPACAQMAREAVGNGMAVVIGLQSTGEANTELLKETAQNEFDDLVSAPRMVLEQYVRTQFPMDKGGAEQHTLDSLEYQVFQAINEWRQMLPASEVVAQKAEGQEVAHAAALMGLRVNAKQRQSEDEVIAMRLKMKKLAQEDEERRAEARRAERADKWKRQRNARERSLRVEVEEAQAEVATTEAMLAKLEQGPPKAAAAAKGVQATAGKSARAGAHVCLEDNSSDEEDAPLSTGVPSPAGGKRKAVVLDDLDSDLEGSGSEGGANKSARAALQTHRRRGAQLDSSSSEDEDEALPLSARPPLAAAGRGASGSKASLTGAAAAVGAPLVLKQLSSPVVIDLTLDDELRCMVCGLEEDGHNMLLCDGCDRGCHAQCAGLRCIPTSSTWFCTGCSSKQAGGTTAAATRAAKGQQQRLVGLKQQKKTGREPDYLFDDSDSDLQFLPLRRANQAVTGGTQAQKTHLVAAQHRLQAARRRLRTAELELEAFQEGTAAGPPPTPPRATRLSTRQVDAGPSSARPGSSSFDPTVRNLQLGSARPEGYRHAVKVHDLTDLTLPDEDELAAGPTGGTKKGKGKKKQQRRREYDENGEELSDEDELLEMDEDFPVPDGEMNHDVSPQLMRMRAWLLRIIQAMELPPNPLDQLVELLGGEQHVAELTGRKGYVAKDEENGGRHMYMTRGGDCPKKDLNLREKEAFMEGRKLVAVISDAASTGISLQADRRVANQRRRCHITLELPWSADKAIQQFGRSHRANQVSAPLYRILTVPVGGEYRFAAAAAKRLASLGALLRGDRNAIGAGSELKAFDIDNAHGERALVRVLHDICGTNGSKPMPGVKVPDLPAGLALPEFLNTNGRDVHNEYRDDPTPPFFKYMRVKLVSISVLEQAEPRSELDEPAITVPTQKAKLKIPRFLNRLLGLPMEDQELLFQYFTDTMDATIAQLKSEGRYDSGIVTVKGRSCQVVGKRVIYQDEASGGEVFHVELSLDRGVPWEAALSFKNEVEEKLEEQEPGRKHLSGFYVQRGRDIVASGQRRPYILLATEIIKSATNIRNTRFHIQRPNTGSDSSMTLAEMDDKGYRRLTLAEAEPIWRFWFEWCEDRCYHGDNCSERRRGGHCTTGTRKHEMHIICGAVLPIWQKLESMHNHSSWGRRRPDGCKWPLRVVKTIQEDGSPVVGVEATCREELEFFVRGLNAAREQADEEEADPTLAAAMGFGYGGGYGAAAAAAFGVAPYVPRGGRGRGRGKRPRNFR